jgi:hypothetical protein
MSKAPSIVWIAVALVVVGMLWGWSAVSRLREARRQIFTMCTFNVGRDLIAYTNSALLVGIDPGLHASLAEVLASTTHIASVKLGDEYVPVGGRRASSVLQMTNEIGEGVAMRLAVHDDSTHMLRFDVLSHRKFTEPDGAANSHRAGQ